VELTGDLTPETVAEALPGRPVRAYPAVLSTHADALAWARAGAPEGAVVVAEYQASPRGRAGMEWHAAPSESLAFSLVLRPRLPLPREGWLYVAVTCGLGDALGPDAELEWPDEVYADGERAAAVGIQTELEAVTTEWAVVSVLVEHARPPRAAELARVVEAIESRYRSSTVPVLADYLRRCRTIGRRVRARMIPLGPGGVVIEGTAVNVLTDGALVLETAAERRTAVRPQSLGRLEPA
jgi:BirA family transcriptional regulator, biotin operon repressor / biotin---[acetyl-CoA-carboxylase] ligase